MSAGTPARPVRVIILGRAGPLSHAPHVLRLERQDGGVVLLPKDCPGVVVEDRAPELSWTDGDVVQSVSSDYVLWRGDTGWPESRDAAVTRDVDAGLLRVLRCQARELEATA